MTPDIGARVVAALGDRAARELLGVLERSDADRAELIEAASRPGRRSVARRAAHAPRGRGW